MNMSVSEGQRLFGTDKTQAPHRILRAGALDMRLENGNLRYVKFGGVEILRAVSYVVRDRDWGTLEPAMTDLEIEEEPTGFRITYQATYENQGSLLTVETEISGESSGTVEFVATACADRDFETNRTGFNILHPIEGVSGSNVTVEHCDGSLEETVFPDLIEPWQPFKSIRALTHAPCNGLRATCRMEGDVFEMEDQRNWSDASYKTYVRPIELPWPYRIPAGETHRQAVSLSITSQEPQAVRARQGVDVVVIEPGPPSDIAFPKVGLLVSPKDAGQAIRTGELLARVAPHAIICHFDPTAGHNKEAFEDFRRLQDELHLPFDLEYVVGSRTKLEDEFERLRDSVAGSGLVLSSLAVCPSVDRQSTPPGSKWPDCPPLQSVYEAARKFFPDVPLGGGMFSYFTELNRKRPPLDLLDFVTHATNPIVHAADDISVMETLETLPHITRSARAIIGNNASYRIGPSSIGMRQNPYGSRTFENPDGDRICMSHDDPRQRGQFAAAWTIGYASAIAPAGVEKWVPCSFAGQRGLVREEGGALLPVGRAVSWLTRLREKRLLHCSNTAPRRVAVLCLDTGAQTEFLIANLTPEQVQVDCRKRVSLGPYEILWL